MWFFFFPVFEKIISLPYPVIRPIKLKLSIINDSFIISKHLAFPEKKSFEYYRTGFPTLISINVYLEHTLSKYMFVFQLLSNFSKKNNKC